MRTRCIGAVERERVYAVPMISVKTISMAKGRDRLRVLTWLEHRGHRIISPRPYTSHGARGVWPRGDSFPDEAVRRNRTVSAYPVYRVSSY